MSASLRTRASSLVLSIIFVAGGGAAGAVAAYATNHNADDPVIFGAIFFAARELTKYLDRRDPTRTLRS